MQEGQYVKRSVNDKDTERLLKDIKTYEAVRFHRVGVVERSRVLQDLDVSAAELAAILSAGGPKVTAKDVERWTSEEHPEDDSTSSLFRSLLTGFVLIGDIPPLNRLVPVGSPLAAVGSETGRKAPRTKAKRGEPADLSAAISAAEAAEAVASNA
jgi:hypothetical protein